jgi:ABC-type multidrug transport system fused ATPase/permease subunit
LPENTEDVPEVKVSRLTKDAIRSGLAIFRYVLPYKGVFFLGLIFLVLSSVTVLAFPFVTGKLVDSAMGNVSDMFSSRNKVAFFLGGILLLQSIFSFFRVVLFARVNERALADLRRDLYNKIISLPMTYFEQKRVGELMSRITNDVTTLQDTFSITLAELFRQSFTLLIGIAIITFISPKLTLIMLATVPLLVIMAYYFGKYLRKIAKRTQDALAKANIVVEETFQTIHTVKAFTNELYESRRYETGIKYAVQLALKASFVRGSFISFVIFSMLGGLIFVLWVGTGMVESGTMPIGDLVSFIIYTTFIGGSIGGLGDTFSKILSSLGASERLNEILGKSSEVDFDANIIPAKLHRDITFNEVHFTYPARPDIEVIKGMTFQIQQGEKVALVGPSGAGKSTIVQLLLRFYDINSGQIFIGGKDINTLPVQTLRSNMAIVPQEVLLFGGSLRENIAYGKQNATDEEIISAAIKANAWDFIQKFPEKLNTLVGERGIKLSGGQRQRIAIARAILKDPGILLLDEATSSLDAESEREVQEALDTLMEGRTTIIIAHRLSTVRNVDKILVINNGEIIESGSHDELMGNTDGMYSHLLKLQYQLH